MGSNYSTQGSVVVHRIRTGKAGKDSINYYLTADPSNLTLDADGKIKGNSTVSVQAWLSIGGASPAKASDGDVYLVIEAIKTDGTSAGFVTAAQKASHSFNASSYLALGACRFEVRLYDGQAKTSLWDSISVTIGAKDALDSVRLDLDNENDSILYDGTGNTKLSGNVVSHATLYDGSKALTSGSDVTFSIPQGGKVNCEATLSGNTITVSSLSGVNASVTIHCYYARTKQTYQAVFSVRKLLGTDKYDLVLSTKDVHFNTSTGKVVAGSPVSVQVYRTPGNGGTRHLVGSLSTYGLSLSFSPSFSVTYNNGVNLTITDAIGKANSEIAITLKKGTVVEDVETVMIVKTQDGTSPFHMELSNERTMVNCDYNGNPVSGAVYETSKVQVFYGSKNAESDFTFTASADGITHGFNANTLVISPSAITKDTATITITATGKTGTQAAGKTLQGVMTISKNKPGKPGDDAVMYSLVPDHSVIHKNKDGGFIDSTMRFRVVKVKGAALTLLTTHKQIYDEGLRLMKDGGSNFISSSSTSLVEIATATYFTSDHVEFVLKLGSAEVDREGIDCVYDGQTGGKGDTLSYVIEVVTARINFVSGTQQVQESEIIGNAYQIINGVQSGVDLSDSENNWVQLRFYGRNSGYSNSTIKKKITYTADSNGHFDDDDDNDGDLHGYILGRDFVSIDLYVGKVLVATHDIKLLLPGADGYNYLPINNGPYSSDRTYTWDSTKRDFVDVEEDAGNGGKEWNRYGVARFGLTVPANYPPPNSSYWTKVQSNIPTLIANTIFGTNANIGGFIASANRFLSSQVAYYVRYCGTYSSSTTYKYETPTGLKAPRLDLVLYNEKYYVPLAPGSLSNILPTNTNYWRLATAEEIKVTENAIYSVLTLYKIEMNGIDGIIRVLHQDGYRWEVQKNGVQLLGNDAGRHIELDPANREIRIYNDSGQLAVRFDGTTETRLSTIFGTETDKSASFTEATGSRKKSGNYNAKTSETYSVVIGNITTASAGRIRFTGTFKARSNYTWAGSQWNDEWYQMEDDEYYMIPSRPYSGSLDYYWTNYINARVVVKNYDNATSKRLLSTSYVAWAGGYGGDKWNETSLTKDVVVPSGYHEITIEYDVHLVKNGSAYGEVAWNSVTASFTADYYLSRIFANGLAFGSSAKNSFAVARNSSGNVEMRCSTKNNEYGMQVLEDGMSTIFKDKFFKPTVLLGYGLVTSSNTNGTHRASWSHFINGMRDDYSSPVITNRTEGVWKIAYTDKWKSLGLSKSNLVVTVVPNMQNFTKINMVGLYEVTTTDVTVGAGDDDSPNTGISFWVKFEYILP